MGINFILILRVLGMVNIIGTICTANDNNIKTYWINGNPVQVCLYGTFCIAYDSRYDDR